MPSQSTLFERALLTVTMCAVLTTLLTAGTLVSPALRARLTTEIVPVAYDLGDLIDLPPQVFEDAKYTAVLFARQSCGASMRAMPTYQRIVRELRALPSTNVRLISDTSTWDADREYANGIGVRPVEHIATSLRTLRVRRVPTLVIVDQGGTVVGAWEGAPDESQQNPLPLTVAAVLRR